MHEDGLVLLDRVLNEVVDRLGCRVLLVEDHGRLEVHPLESQVSDTATLPVIRHLLARAVDDVRHLIGNDELLVLCFVSFNNTYLGSETIAYKQAILNLDGSDHVLGELHHALVHHLVHLHLHHLLVHLLLLPPLVGCLVLPARSLLAL